mmetsp:Transcript_28867/g.59093  ORF Transcript_28867/g.59093 Transcript_28867/m.59093 type:complete len:83 (-) Transcript_28867:631-879(-)
MRHAAAASAAITLMVQQGVPIPDWTFEAMMCCMGEKDVNALFDAFEKHRNQHVKETNGNTTVAQIAASLSPQIILVSGYSGT